MIKVIRIYDVFEVFFFENYFLVKIFMLECMPIYDVFLFCSKLFAPFRGKVVQKWPIWGHHTQIHRFYGIKRWNTMRKKISDLYKPRKKLSQHAHESIKPCLYGTGALEVGAEKKSQ